MEDFKIQVTNIASNIKNLESNVTALEERIQKKLSSVLDINEENQTIREIAAIEQIFKETSLKIKQDLEEMEYQSKNSTTLDIIFQEARKNHWLALTMKLKRLCAQFNSIQTNYKAKEEQKLISQYMIENPNLTISEIQAQVKNNQSQHLKEFEKAKVRHKEIKRIAETINDLSFFIDELQEIIKQQKTNIDRIEVKMTGSLDTTSKAKKIC